MYYVESIAVTPEQEVTHRTEHRTWNGAYREAHRQSHLLADYSSYGVIRESKDHNMFVISDLGKNQDCMVTYHICPSV